MSLGLETENLNRVAEQFPQMIAIQITLDPGKRHHGKLPAQRNFPSSHDERLWWGENRKLQGLRAWNRVGVYALRRQVTASNIDAAGCRGKLRIIVR